MRYDYDQHSHSQMNDVAVLTLSKPVQITEFVKPVCLNSENDNFVGQAGTVAGWGSLFEGT